MRLSAWVAVSLAVCCGMAFAQAAPLPPRDVSDILAILDQYQPEPLVVDKLRARAAAPVPETNHRQELAVFHHRRARANGDIGDVKRQIADLNKALEYVLPSGLPDKEGFGDRIRILYDIVDAEVHGGNWVRVIEVSRELARNQGGPGFTGQSFIVQASVVLHDIDQARTAISVADQSLARLKTTASWRTFGALWEMASERSHGLLLMAQGNFAEAERRIRNSLEFGEMVSQKALQARSYGGSGRLRTSALTHLGLAEMFLSSNLLVQGRTAEAEYYARAALLRNLQASGRFSPHTALSITVLGEVLMEGGRFREAEALARVAISTFEGSGASPESLTLARARYALAGSLAMQGRWSEAVRVFESLRHGLASEPAQFARVGGQNPVWAVAMLRTGANDEALSMLEGLYRRRLRSGFPDNDYLSAQTRGFLAMALSAAGQHAKALEAFRGAIPILLMEAGVRSQTDQGGAVGQQIRLVWILEAYMHLLIELRDSPLLKEAGIDATDEAFRIADVARGSSVQRAMEESAARTTFPDPALAQLARREQDARRRFSSLSAILNRLLSAPRERQLPKTVEGLRRDIDLIEGERKRLRTEIDARYPAYGELISAKPATPEQVRQVLADGEALVSIYVGAERGYVWSVSKRGPVAFAELALADAQIAAHVAELRRSLDVGDVALDSVPRFDLARSHELYRRLLLPVEPAWREARSLIVIPHKSLGQLPFAVLTTAAPSAMPISTGSALFSEYREASWLIRRVALAQLPSASALLSLRRMTRPTAARREFIGFGDPIFSNRVHAVAAAGEATRRRFRDLGVGSAVTARSTLVVDAPVPLPGTATSNSAGLAQLPRLPDTAEEIESIAKVLRADMSADVFLGKAASERNVKSKALDETRVLMFATHGLIPGDLNGLTQPALALSAPEVTGDSADDGLLTMDEVLGLKLNADWVVLSACNTASGDGAGSEAVSGLGKAFFFAGARSLLVSNWPVETVSARLLTTKLFEHQSTHADATRAQALRATMLDLMQRGEVAGSAGDPRYTYAHPMFWAPFTLVGDGAR